MTEALQKVTRETKAMSADKYDVTAQGETGEIQLSGRPAAPRSSETNLQHSVAELNDFYVLLLMSTAYL